MLKHMTYIHTVTSCSCAIASTILTFFIHNSNKGTWGCGRIVPPTLNFGTRVEVNCQLHHLAALEKENIMPLLGFGSPAPVHPLHKPHFLKNIHPFVLTTLQQTEHTYSACCIKTQTCAARNENWVGLWHILMFLFCMFLNSEPNKTIL